MAMIGKVKRMHFRGKRSVREIVRLTSLSRNTVRKWLKTAVLVSGSHGASQSCIALWCVHSSSRIKNPAPRGGVLEEGNLAVLM